MKLQDVLAWIEAHPNEPMIKGSAIKGKVIKRSISDSVGASDGGNGSSGDGGGIRARVSRGGGGGTPEEFFDVGSPEDLAAIERQKKDKERSEQQKFRDERIKADTLQREFENRTREDQERQRKERYAERYSTQTGKYVIGGKIVQITTGQIGDLERLRKQIRGSAIVTDPRGQGERLISSRGVNFNNTAELKQFNEGLKTEGREEFSIIERNESGGPIVKRKLYDTVDVNEPIPPYLEGTSSEDIPIDKDRPTKYFTNVGSQQVIAQQELTEKDLFGPTGQIDSQKERELSQYELDLFIKNNPRLVAEYYTREDKAGYLGDIRNIPKEYLQFLSTQEKPTDEKLFPAIYYDKTGKELFTITGQSKGSKFEYKITDKEREDYLNKLFENANKSIRPDVNTIFPFPLASASTDQETISDKINKFGYEYGNKIARIPLIGPTLAGVFEAGTYTGASIVSLVRVGREFTQDNSIKFYNVPEIIQGKKGIETITNVPKLAESFARDKYENPNIVSSPVFSGVVSGGGTAVLSGSYALAGTQISQGFTKAGTVISRIGLPRAFTQIGAEIVFAFPRALAAIPFRFSKIAFEGVGKIRLPAGDGFYQGPKALVTRGITLGYEGKYSIGLAMRSSEGKNYILSRLKPESLNLENFRSYVGGTGEVAEYSKLTQAKILTKGGAKELERLGKIKESEFVDLVVKAKPIAKDLSKTLDVKIGTKEMAELAGQLELTGVKGLDLQIINKIADVQSTKTATKLFKEAKKAGNEELAQAYKPFTEIPYPKTKGSFVNIFQLAKYNLNLIRLEKLALQQGDIISANIIREKRVPARTIGEIGDVDVDLLAEVQARQLYNVLNLSVKTPKGTGFGIEGLNIKYGKISGPSFTGLKQELGISYHGTSTESEIAKTLTPRFKFKMDYSAKPFARLSYKKIFFTSRTPELAISFLRRAVKRQGGEPIVLKVKERKGSVIEYQKIPKQVTKLLQSKDYSKFQGRVLGYMQDVKKFAIEKPYKTINRLTKRKEVLFTDISPIESIERVKPTGFEIGDGKKIINQLGKLDELPDEISRYGSGKILGVTPSKKLTSIGKLKTTKISTQGLYKLKSVLTLTTRETLDVFKQAASPENYQRTLSRFGDYEMIVRTPLKRTKDIPDLYGILRFSARTSKGIFKERRVKRLDEYAENLKKYNTDVDFLDELRPLSFYSQKLGGKSGSRFSGKTISGGTTFTGGRSESSPKSRKYSSVTSVKSSKYSPKSVSYVSPKSVSYVSPKSVSYVSPKSVSPKSPFSTKSISYVSPKSVSPKSPFSQKSPFSPKSISYVSPKSVSPKSPFSQKSPFSPKSFRPFSPKSPFSPESPKSVSPFSPVSPVSPFEETPTYPIFPPPSRKILGFDQEGKRDRRLKKRSEKFYQVYDISKSPFGKIKAYVGYSEVSYDPIESLEIRKRAKNPIAFQRPENIINIKIGRAFKTSKRSKNNYFGYVDPNLF